MSTEIKKEMDMINGPIFKNILRFSVPLMLSSMLQLLYNAADVIVVGQFASDHSLAAVSSTGSLINLIVNLFMGLSVGASVVVSQNIGAGRAKDVEEAVHTSIAISIVSGILVGIFGFFAAGGLLRLMDSPENVIGLSTIYVQIYFLGMPANMIYNFGSAILRAVGETKKPMYYLMFSGLVNVILNLIFVIVLKMDVAGVALATIISQIISAFLVIRLLLRYDGMVKLIPSKIKIHMDKLKKIAAVGLPAGIQGSLFSISNVLIQSSINAFGSEAMAGNGAAANLEGFIYVAMNAIHQAAITFTGQNYGAGKIKRIKTICLECMATVAAIGLGMGILFDIFGEILLSIYTDSAVEIEFGMVRFTVICFSYFLCGTMDVMVGMLRGIGSSITPMIVTVSCVCGLRIVWLYTVYASFRATCTEPHQCLLVLLISYPVSWIIATAVHIGCFIFHYHRLKKKTDLKAKEAV